MEVAEFDCRHDEDLSLADALKATGVPVERNETKDVTHGYGQVPRLFPLRELL